MIPGVKVVYLGETRSAGAAIVAERLTRNSFGRIAAIATNPKTKIAMAAATPMSIFLTTAQFLRI